MNLPPHDRGWSTAVGLSGLDGLLAEAEQLDPELGAVGRPVRSHPELLDLLTARGFLPVVACIGGGAAGEIYNVNADQMAVSCASGFRADKLLFLTDVEGVMDAKRRHRAKSFAGEPSMNSSRPA